jgi:hypothetical protein
MVMLIVEPEQALPWNLRGVINDNDPFKSCVTATSTPSNLKTQDNISKNEGKTAVKASKMYEIRRISRRQKSRPRRQKYPEKKLTHRRRAHRRAQRILLKMS